MRVSIDIGLSIGFNFGLMTKPNRDYRAHNLREWRLRRGLTQEELAAEALMSKSGIQGLENGRTPGRKSTWIRLARALNIDIETLSEPPRRAAG